MDKKVKVWGKEIDNCGKCFLCREIEDSTSGTNISCGWDGHNVFEDNQLYRLNKDCPFSEPITKEVIEGLGFKENITNSTFEADKKYTSKYRDYYNINGIWIHEIIGSSKYQITFNGNKYEKVMCPEMKFCGTINNSMELKFILKSLGVLI